MSFIKKKLKHINYYKKKRMYYIFKIKKLIKSQVTIC